MPVKVIRSTDAMTVAHPAFLIYSSTPGVGRSSLAYMTRKPLLLDFDKGAHRAGNRRDTVQPETWADVEELLRSDVIAEYETIVMDTVGRFLDLLTVDIIEKNPKHGRGDGTLAQQGWGALKSRFKTTLDRLSSRGKDLVMVAHGKEEKDGDNVIMRPDIQGGSYGEVLKSADFVGYLYMQGKGERALDFSPTERWIGKNPGGWATFKVPVYGKDTEFLSHLIDEARSVLGRISEESAAAAQLIAEWRGKVEAFTTAKEMTAAVPDVSKIEPVIVREQVKRALWGRAKGAGLAWDAGKKAFVTAKKEDAAEPAAEPAAAGA
jgi:AAA domain-containing protein